MQDTTSSVLSDIDAIIARALEECGSTYEPTRITESPTTEVSDSVEDPSADEGLIPDNIHIEVREQATSRFSSAIWYEKVKEQDIILAGLGGIGSWTALQLARLGVNSLYNFDNDRVEAGNMSGQLYGRDDIGKFKANALYDALYKYSTVEHIYSYNELYTRDSLPGPIMICGFDNMEARKTFYYNWKDYISHNQSTADKCLFIDARLAAEELQIFCIVGTDTYSMGRYEKDYLFSDREADETICSYKQTTFMANMIGSLIANLFVNFIANQCNPLVPRDLPFFTTYAADTMFLKVKA